MMAKLIPWIVFFSFGYYLMGPLLGAKLGMVDDHEIPYFLGSDGVVTLTQLPEVLAKTELGEWGQYLRFRPSYYTLRVIETMWWRDNATLWFLTRYLMLVGAMWLGWRLMSQYFPAILSYLFIFYALTMPYWADIWTRLGPSETYAVLALALFGYGWQFGRSGMVLLGYVIAVGSKENMLFLLPLLLVWAGQKMVKKTLTKAEGLGILAALGFTGWIMGGILLATSRAGVDIYGAEISYRYRLTKFMRDIPQIIAERDMYFSVLAAVGLTVAALNKKYRKQVMRPLGCLYLLFFSVSTQYVFYPNTLPSHSRYDFPALLLIRVLDVVAIYGVMRLGQKGQWQRWVKLILLGIFCGYTLLGIYRYRYVHLEQRAKAVVTSTRSFGDKLEKIKTTAKQQESATLVLVSERSIDFEGVAAVLRYLVAASLANRLELKYTQEPGLSDPLAQHLGERLRGAMTGENKEELFARFEPFSNPTQNCYSLTYGNAPALPSCPELARF